MWHTCDRHHVPVPFLLSGHLFPRVKQSNLSGRMCGGSSNLSWRRTFCLACKTASLKTLSRPYLGRGQSVPAVLCPRGQENGAVLSRPLYISLLLKKIFQGNQDITGSAVECRRVLSSHDQHDLWESEKRACCQLAEMRRPVQSESPFL